VSARRRASALVWIAAVAAAAGCAREDTSRNQVAGEWRAARPGSRVFALRADGTLDLPVTTDQRCADDAAAIAACRLRQHWDRHGARVRIWPAFVASSGGPAGGGFVGMFDKPAPPGTPPCVCKVDPEPTVFELRDRDTLVAGDEVVTRVR